MALQILINKMDRWYQHDPGQYFLQFEQTFLDKVLPELYGHHLIQIGITNCYRFSAANAITHHTYLGPMPVKDFPGSVVQSLWSELPLQVESVDVIVLSHVLEFMENPQQLLHEISQILIPGGTLILFGFNPFSLWGFYKMLGFQKQIPWSGKFYPIGRVKHWLRSFELNIVEQKTFCFRPPIKNSQLFDKLLFLEPVGQLFWPFGGGGFVLMVQKTAVPLIPVKSRAFVKKISVPRGFPEPTTISHR
jgi:SAM-dependent methyltransferase